MIMHETRGSQVVPWRRLSKPKRMPPLGFADQMSQPKGPEDGAFLECWFETEARDRITGVSTRLSS